MWYLILDSRTFIRMTKAYPDCTFPFILEGKMYARSCARSSIYDPGVCATKVNEKLEALETRNCDIENGEIKHILILLSRLLNTKT